MINEMIEEGVVVDVVVVVVDVVMVVVDAGAAVVEDMVDGDVVVVMDTIETATSQRVLT